MRAECHCRTTIFLIVLLPAYAFAQRADNVASIRTMANNPDNYRVVTGQVFNVMLSDCFRWFPESTQTEVLSKSQGVIVFKEGARTVAITNFQGASTSPKRVRVLQVGEFRSAGKTVPLLDCGMKPVGSNQLALASAPGRDSLGQLYHAITYENVPKAKAALAAGIDWANDGKTDHQWSTLHFAVGHTSSNGVEILKLLLATRADVNATAEYRQTPLHFAAQRGNTVAVKLLIEQKADLDARQRDRKTPLHLAASNGHVEVAKMLIENKANLNARDLYNNTPLMCAVVAKHNEVETLLRQHGAKAR
ncbi:MAG TPA: ankyrin repeat domain-containing protein [Verrucomicrobiae bacterium]|nr:ankyrin repeat domain-containing protein [Verrucomicrobiae bacterium]